MNQSIDEPLIIRGIKSLGIDLSEIEKYSQKNFQKRNRNRSGHCQHMEWNKYILWTCIVLFLILANMFISFPAGYYIYNTTKYKSYIIAIIIIILIPFVIRKYDNSYVERDCPWEEWFAFPLTIYFLSLRVLLFLLIIHTFYVIYNIRFNTKK